MKKRNLFICETPFQVLAAILILLDRHQLDINDFILTDNMKDYRSIQKNMQCFSFVNYAYGARVKHVKRAGYLFDEVLPFNKRWNYRYTDSSYDKIYLRNYTASIAVSCFNFFQKKNRQLEICIIDEGYSNYTSEFWNSEQQISKLHSLVNKLMIRLGKVRIYDNISRALFFQPQLLHINVPFKIDKMFQSEILFSNEQIKNINQIFEYNNLFLGDCKRIFIFFEECFSFDANNNSDIQILNILADIIGKEKIIVKLHPRSAQDRFTPLGYRVLNVKYSWEVFALNNARNEKITLLAYSSGAVLNYLLFTKSKIKSILLYKVFPDMYKHMNNPEIQVWFDELCKEYADVIEIPNSKKELEERLKACK